MDPGHIDLSYLERLFKGDRARINGWIQIYLEEAPTLFRQLRDAQTTGDVEHLARVAHDLRPQAHYLGSPRMLELLIRVAQDARTLGNLACVPHLDELHTIADRVAMELNAVITKS